MSDKPAFEIVSNTTASRIAIYADGRVTGIEREFTVVNRIPALIADAVCKATADLLSQLADLD